MKFRDNDWDKNKNKVRDWSIIIKNFDKDKSKFKDWENNNKIYTCKR